MGPQALDFYFLIVFFPSHVCVSPSRCSTIILQPLRRLQLLPCQGTPGRVCHEASPPTPGVWLPGAVLRHAALAEGGSAAHAWLRFGVATPPISTWEG